jgi:hypothetical protein
MRRPLYGWLLAALLPLSLLAADEPAAAPPRRPYQVPRLEKIQIDGDAADWDDRGFRVEFMRIDEDRERPEPANFSARFRLGWDETGLLILIEVQDDIGLEHQSPDRFWQWDDIELFLAEAVGSPQYYQAIISPGIAPDQPELRVRMYEKRTAPPVPDIAIEAARTKTKEGYICEVRMPWRNLAVAPEAGQVFGFQLYVQDADREQSWPFSPMKFVWFPQASTHRDQTAMHAIELAEATSPPEVGGVQIMPPLIHCIGLKSLAGHDVVARIGDRELARGRFPDTARGHEVRTTLTLPPLLPGESLDRLTVAATTPAGTSGLLAIHDLVTDASLPVNETLKALDGNRYEVVVRPPEEVGLGMPWHVRIVVQDGDGTILSRQDAKPGDACTVALPAAGIHTLALSLLDARERVAGRKFLVVEDGKPLMDAPDEPLVLAIPEVCCLANYRGAEHTLSMRPRIIAELVRNYHCRVLSRREGLLLATEAAIQQMASLRADGGTGTAIPAVDHVMASGFNLAERTVVKDNIALAATYETTLQFYDFTDPREDRFTKVSYRGNNDLDEIIRRVVLQLRLRPRTGEATLTATPRAETWAVMPFIRIESGRGGVDDRSAAIEMEIALQAGNLVRTIVDRAQIDRILAELRIASLGDASEGGAATVARLAGADRVLVNMVGVADHVKGGLRLDVFLVDTATGMILDVRSAYCQALTLGEVGAQLAADIARHAQDIPALKPSLAERRIKEGQLYMESLRTANRQVVIPPYLAALIRHYAESAFLLAQDDPPLALALAKLLAHGVSWEKLSQADRDFAVGIVEKLHARHDDPLAEAMLYAYFNTDRPEAALAFAEKMPLENEQERHFYRAKAQVAMGRLDEAEAELQHSPQHWPGVVKLRAEIGKRKGDDQARLAALKKFNYFGNYASRPEPLELMRLTAHLESPAAALSLLNRFKAWIIVRPDIQLEIAKCHLALGNTDKAKAIVQRLQSPKMALDDALERDHKGRHAQELAELASRLGCDGFAWKTAAETRSAPPGYAICVQPLGNVLPSILDPAAKQAKDFLGDVEVIILPSLPLPQDPVAYHRARFQYEADAVATRVFPVARKRIPENALGLILITEQDLFLDDLRFIYALDWMGAIPILSYQRWHWAGASDTLAEMLAKTIASSSFALHQRRKVCLNPPCLNSSSMLSDGPNWMEFGLCEECQEDWRAMDFEASRQRFQSWRPPPPDAETARLNAEYRRLVEGH